MKNNYLASFLITLVLIVGVFLTSFNRQHPQSNIQTPQVAGIQNQLSTNSASISATIGQRTKTTGCITKGALPDKACTPGAVFSDVTKDQICISGYSKSVRNVPTNVKDEVYNEYGIVTHSTGEYEVDHLISLELGGSNDLANLWPEPAEPRPGFHEKDRVENLLHQEVCNGSITLEQAQLQISSDWLQTYKQLSP